MLVSFAVTTVNGDVRTETKIIDDIIQILNGKFMPDKDLFSIKT